MGLQIPAVILLWSVSSAFSAKYGNAGYSGGAHSYGGDAASPSYAPGPSYGGGGDNDGSYGGYPAASGGGGGGDGGGGYATGDGNGYTGVAAPPSKYPPAMTHERNRQQSGYVAPASVKKFHEHFEGLFDDFPGPKTKAKIYYPGRGYITMQVPVQQPDQYSKGGYSSGSYSAPSSNYDDSSSGSSYSSPPYGGGGGSRPAPYSNSNPDDDSDSPFAYMGKKSAGGGSYSPPSYSAPAPPYKPPSYQPGPSGQSYQPPKPSYGGGSGQYNNNYGSGTGSVNPKSGNLYISYNDMSPNKPYVSPQTPDVSTGGGYGGPSGGYNPSGYKPSSYPSSYPDGEGDSSRSYPSRDGGRG